jgi:hypothetical protein
VSYLDYYDHHHSRIEFYALIGYAGISSREYMGCTAKTLDTLKPETLTMLRETRQSFKETLEWRTTHDMYELQMNWTMGWITENEAKLYSWEFDSSCRNPITVRADVVQGSWFEPPIWSGGIEEEVRLVDGASILWYIEWREMDWREPFRVWSHHELVSQGIVKDIHLNW